MHIKIKKGLDLPIQIPRSETIISAKPPSQIGATFEGLGDRLKLLVKTGDSVKVGSPLALHKDYANLLFVSPGGGKVGEIRRGERRRLLSVTIDLDENESAELFAPCDIERASRQELIDHFKRAGLFFHLRKRPFSQICNPDQLPRSIFVKAVESAPGVPPAELQIRGLESPFQTGLRALARLAPVHLVYRQGSSLQTLDQIQGVERHTVDGPHPSANSSLHIAAIDPIKSARDTIWTVDAIGVISIGISLQERRYHTGRIVGLAGSGFDAARLSYVATRQGVALSDLTALAERTDEQVSYISGDVLNGMHVSKSDFLGLAHTAITSLPAPKERQFLHFMRLGIDKFTATRTYLSRLFSRFGGKRPHPFTVQQHGDVRAFIDPSVYDAVMPMDIRVVELAKACLAENFDLADRLGLLTVDKEDFALPTFICPSKIEIGQIIETALSKRALDDI